VGFTCPNRDGTVARGGCIYCNNKSFVPPYALSRFTLAKQITTGTEYLKKRFNAEKFLVYFQAYTNTYDKIEKLERLYKEALEHENVVGLVVGTRADCIDQEKVKLFESLAKDWFVALEYGIESIYDKTLDFMNRGHNYQSVLDAIRLTKDRGIQIGAHIILGFPTESEDEMLKMADEVSGLGIDFIKIHNLHIVKNTPLARIYAEKPFHLFSYEEYIDFILRFLERLSPRIIVERLHTDTPRGLLIAPVWGKNRNEILDAIEREFVRRTTFQGKLYEKSS
jgi:radical SAM protein (TIGR01212 family)